MPIGNVLPTAPPIATLPTNPSARRLALFLAVLAPWAFAVIETNIDNPHLAKVAVRQASLVNDGSLR